MEFGLEAAANFTRAPSIIERCGTIPVVNPVVPNPAITSPVDFNRTNSNCNLSATPVMLGSSPTHPSSMPNLGSARLVVISKSWTSLFPFKPRNAGLYIPTHFNLPNANDINIPKLQKLAKYFGRTM